LTEKLALAPAKPSTTEPFGTAPFGIRLGAHILEDGRCEFRVWAPIRERVELEIVSPAPRRVTMTRREDGYHEAILDDTPPGTRYFFVLDGTRRPDPASRLQPEGVHGPSEVVGSEFPWTDGEWSGIPLEDYVVYELHTGTFSGEGTFDAIIGRLDLLRELGITAVELLPVAQFPGTRNWGYDGTYPGAAQNSYGGPLALKRLVNACHERGLAIVLDVVYNHLGPEGNYTAEFGPYFTDRYKTPWGPALNFDGAYSDHVRWFFIHNALQWIDEFHVDALRVDAVHAIVDHSAEPFLQELTSAVRARAETLGRRVYTIAESDLNDPRVITPKERYGLGFDTQWCDDFHHSLHVVLTGEQDGYYRGFGRVSDFAQVWRRGYLFVGQHSEYRGRRYGLDPKTTDGSKFIVCAQNHDQTGNRLLGERLSTLVSYEQLRLAAAAVILSPFIPMLFMGEEYGEKAPFQYFTSHSDADLIEAVRRGRAEEFDDFDWQGEPPDPHDEETFARSRLQWERREADEHAALWRLHQELLRLRREIPALRTLDLSAVETHADDERRVLLVRRGDTLLGFNFGDAAATVTMPFNPAAWRLLAGGEAEVEGNAITLPPFTFALFREAERGAPQR
jgi:maltooligosyltrehalose trehalohydrolase